MCLLYRAIYAVHAVQVKMAAMLQIPRVFPRVSCLGSAKVVQCPRPGPKISNKSKQIPRYSPVCPRGQPAGMAADKYITLHMFRKLDHPSLPRGHDSWCWPKGARPLGMRMGVDKRPWSPHFLLVLTGFPFSLCCGWYSGPAPRQYFFFLWRLYQMIT